MTHLASAGIMKEAAIPKKSRRNTTFREILLFPQLGGNTIDAEGGRPGWQLGKSGGMKNLEGCYGDSSNLSQWSYLESF